LPGNGDRFGADTAARNPTFGFTESEVVLREQILVPGPVDEASRAIGRPHGPKTAKTIVQGALAAKPEVEVWRRPVFSTQRPRLPIRPPIHYGVYLVPLRSCPSELLPLRHCSGRCRKYSKSEGRFCQLRAPIARVPLVRISRNFQGRSNTRVAVEFSQKVENLTTEFRAIVGQSTPKSQISNPHISPKWGRFPPN